MIRCLDQTNLFLQEEFVREKEAEMNGNQGGQGYRQDRRQRNQPSAVEVE